MDRLFLDANILFSAAYRPDAGLRRLWDLPDAELITSAYAAEEARRNLDRPEQRVALAALLRRMRVLGTAPEALPHPPDIGLAEKDLPILAAALAVQATHLLTGDVRHFGRYYGRRVGGTLILPPATYLRARPPPPES